MWGFFEGAKPSRKVSNEAIEIPPSLGSYSVIVDPPTGALQLRSKPHLPSYLYEDYTILIIECWQKKKCIVVFCMSALLVTLQVHSYNYVSNLYRLYMHMYGIKSDALQIYRYFAFINTQSFANLHAGSSCKYSMDLDC